MNRSPRRYFYLLRATGMLLASLSCIPVAADASSGPKVEKNVTVYYEAGRYGGWPANHGLWRWGNEIVVGFTEARYVADIKGHVNSKEPAWDRQARSLDGGETWTVEPMRTLTPTQPGGEVAQTLTQPIDFTARDLALKFRFGDDSKGPSWIYFSKDRCHTWHGPYTLPGFGLKGLSMRTDYQILGKHSLLAFGAGAKANGREGRPLVLRTDDGGLTWKFVTWIAPEPSGYAIMPSTVRLSKSELFTAIRRKENDGTWIEAYRSMDNGQTWTLEGRPVPSTGVGANPPSMIRLRDGRLCLTYGYRGDPHSIRARLSSDNGKTWSEDIFLRKDGTENDLGYVRSTQRSDGKVVAVYYFNAPAHAERTIEATIWDPGKK